MSEEKKYLVRDVNLVQFTKWFNEYFGAKKSGELFSVSDVQGYVKRRSIPSYLGGQEIEVNSDRVKGVKCYNIIDINNE